jgi:hypothetical protein
MDHKLISFFAFTRRLAVMLAATALSAVSQATTMNNAGTSLEANLSAGQQPGSPAWWGGTNVFENYGPLTVAEWNGGNTPSWRAASVLQWTLNGFVNSGDTMANRLEAIPTGFIDFKRPLMERPLGTPSPCWMPAPLLSSRWLQITHYRPSM